MTAIRAHAAIIIVAGGLMTAILAAAGCSTRVRETEAASGFAAQLAATPTVGTTPVTVSPALEAVFSAADQLEADDALYASFLAGAPQLEIWHPDAVAEVAGAGAIEALTTDYARLGRLRPDQVRPLAPHLEGCRYLAFGRLVEDEVRTLAQSQATSDPEARVDGQAEHGRPWTSIVSVQRQVRVTLEIFDLVSGESVWRAEATSRDKQLYDYDDELAEDPAAYVQRRIEAADEPSYLSRHGDALKLPDLIGLLGRAFTGLVEQLPAGRS